VALVQLTLGLMAQIQSFQQLPQLVVVVEHLQMA
jgi:hypothetical protein